MSKTSLYEFIFSSKFKKRLLIKKHIGNRR